LAILLNPVREINPVRNGRAMTPPSLPADRNKELRLSNGVKEKMNEL